MKKITFVILFLGLINLGYAQQERRFRTGFDIGLGVGSGESAGFLFAIEPKYNLKDNLNVGFRFEVAGIVKELHYNQGEVSDAIVQANYSFMGTSDYYFHKQGGNSFVPFVGGGIGFHAVGNVYFTGDEYDDNATAYNTKAQSAFGGMIRGGFEWGKFRLTAEYTFIPQTDLQDIDGFVIGKAKNSYFGFNLGFYLGGGKWRR